MVRHRSVVRSAAMEPLGHADADGRLTEDTGQIFGGQSEAYDGTGDEQAHGGAEG